MVYTIPAVQMVTDPSSLGAMTRMNIASAHDCRLIATPWACIMRWWGWGEDGWVVCSENAWGNSQSQGPCFPKKNGTLAVNGSTWWYSKCHWKQPGRTTFSLQSTKGMGHWWKHQNFEMWSKITYHPAIINEPRKGLLPGSFLQRSAQQSHANTYTYIQIQNIKYGNGKPAMYQWCSHVQNVHFVLEFLS